MAKRTRMAIGLAAVALLGWSRSAAADEAAVAPDYMATETHLRWETEALGVAIQDAIERSATFRELVAAINASDSYVIISAGHCGHGVRACFVTVTSSGPRRFMWVKVDTHYYTTDADLMGSIGTNSGIR